MPNDTVQAAATGLPETDGATPVAAVITAPENCRAFQLGAEIGRLSERIRLGFAAPSEGISQGEALRRLDEIQVMEERLDAIATTMTFSVATSLPGALAQIIVCFDQVGDVVESVNITPEETIRILRGAQRCLFSVAGVLAAHGGGQQASSEATALCRTT